MGKSRASKETRQARRQAARNGPAQRPPSRRWPLWAAVAALALVSAFGAWRYWQAERLEGARNALEQAERERAAGRLSAADAAYRRALEASPSAAAWNGLGVVYAMQRDFEGAARCFGEALALDPRFFEARAGLAIARQNAGDFSAAEEQYRLAIELRPSFAGTYYNLGFLYQSQGLHAAAEEQYRRALRIDSTLVQAQANLLDGFVTGVIEGDEILAQLLHPVGHGEGDGGTGEAGLGLGCDHGSAGAGSGLGKLRHVSGNLFRAVQRGRGAWVAIGGLRGKRGTDGQGARGVFRQAPSVEKVVNACGHLAPGRSSPGFGTEPRRRSKRRSRPRRTS